MLDPQANDTHGPRISRLDSAVSVWVMPTNEALMVARHTFALTVRSGNQGQVDGHGTGRLKKRIAKYVKNGSVKR